MIYIYNTLKFIYKIIQIKIIDEKLKFSLLKITD